jgi:GT2 family glycosyltransferase
MSIAIVIPVFNGLKYLQNSLPPIMAQINAIEHRKFTIIVADDNSNDGTAEWLNLNYPGIIVLKGDGNLWWSGGINLGVRYALADQEYQYVLLWNHDTICAENFFNNLIKNVDKYNSKTIIASKVYFLAKPDVLFGMGAFFNPTTGKLKMNGYGMTDSAEFNHPVQVDWTGGMGTLIPVEVFRQVGLFDQKNFPQYYGDCDFFLRAKEKGFILMALPDLKIWNDKSSSGLEHKAQWRLFLRTLTSIKSNYNIAVAYKFRKRHCTSFVFHFYFLYSNILYFGSFFKHWLKSLFR